MSGVCRPGALEPWSLVQGQDLELRGITGRKVHPRPPRDWLSGELYGGELSRTKLSRVIISRVEL